MIQFLRYPIERFFGKNSPVNLVIFIVILAAILRFFHLDYYSLWNDELFFIDLSKTATIFRTANSYHFPLAPLIIKLTTSFLGESDFVVRLPFAIFSVLSVFAIYLLGKRLFNSRIGVVAALLMAISVYAISKAQEAKHYSLLIFLTIIAIYYFFELLKGRRSLINFLMFFGALFFSVYAGYVGAISVVVFISLLIVLSVNKLISKFIKNNNLSFLLTLILILFIVLLPSLISAIHPILITSKTINLSISPISKIFEADRINLIKAILTDYSNNFYLYLIFFSLGILSPFIDRKKKIDIWLFLYTWIILLLGYFLILRVRIPLRNESGDFHVAWSQYYISFLPVYFLIIALGIDNLVSKFCAIIKHDRPNSSLPKIILVIILVFFMSYSYIPLRDYYFETQAFRPDWRAAGKYLADNVSEGDAFVRGARDERDTNYVSHYFDYENLGIDYTLFPLKEKKNNWYVGDLIFPYFEDWTISSAIHPTQRSFSLRVSKLYYIGQGNEVVKIADRKNWEISARSNTKDLNNLIDNNQLTRWESLPPRTDGEYLRIDIGEKKILTQVLLQSIPIAYYIKDYLIQTSLDGQSWTDIQQVSTSSDPYFYYYPLIPFEPTEARFIKIISFGYDQLPWGLSEVELYEVRPRNIANLYNKTSKFTGLVVVDQDTENGYAKFMPKYEPAELRIFQYGERFDLPAGFYRAKFRIKTDDNKTNDDMNDITNATNLVVDVGFEKVGVYLPAPLRIRAREFGQPNSYQEFSLDFEHDGKGHVVFRIRNYGKSNYWFDYPEIEKISQ